jgi:hypothetical protein
MPIELRERMSGEEFAHVLGTVNELTAPGRRSIAKRRVAKRTVAASVAILAWPTIGFSLLGLAAIPFLSKKQKKAALSSVGAVSSYLEEVNSALFLGRGVQWRLTVRPGLNLGMDCPMSAVYAPLILEIGLTPTPPASGIDSSSGLATLRSIQPELPSPIVREYSSCGRTRRSSAPTTTAAPPAPVPSAPYPTEPFTKPSPY